MLKRALWFGFGCCLLGCGGSSAAPAGAGGTGNTAGLANSAGTTNAGGPGTGAGAGGAGTGAGAGGAGTGAGAGGAGTGAGAGAGGRAGSAGSLSGGAGGAGSAGAGGGASAAGAPGTMAEVQAIFDDRCVLCHDSKKSGIPAYPQLSLTVGNARAALVNQQGLEVCGGTLVVPGDPDQSYLVHKLNDATPCEGAHMPRAYEIGTAPPLTVEQMTTIRSWIGAGAMP